MQLYARLSTAVVFGSSALLATLTLLLVWELPELRGMYRLSPSLIYRALWPPILIALLLGATSGGLFEKTTRLCFGVLYAACLGLSVAAPTVYLNAYRLNELIFALTFNDFYKSAERVAVGIYQATGRFTFLEQLIWLPGPLTGIWYGHSYDTHPDKNYRFRISASPATTP